MSQTIAKEVLETRLGRNRFLGFLGAGLFGAATRLFIASPASAEHTGPPAWCFGFPECHCCNGATCCSSGCQDIGWMGCPSGYQCWRVCVYGRLYRCCDWYNPAGDTDACICRGVVGDCGG